jgi:Predicted nucleic acid-binding protein, contains PIN domain
MLVIDASALAALLMPEDGGEEVEKTVKEAERVSTLDLAAYEVGNAVWQRVRRGSSPWRRATLWFLRFCRFWTLLKFFRIEKWQRALLNSPWMPASRCTTRRTSFWQRD